MNGNFKPSLILHSKAQIQPPTISSIITTINQAIFKNLSFKPNQEEIIKASLDDKDLFVCMPTGGGKSLTFQLPAVAKEGITIVVMPLVSLIQDQVDHLAKVGIACRVLGSDKGKKSNFKIYDEIYENKSIKLIYVTPEKLSKSQKTHNFLKALYSESRLVRFAIDEAHCVSQWGREFREDYLKLSSLRQKYPNVPIIALTGTATSKIRDDVISVLKLRQPKIILASFNRPNLFYSVLPKQASKVAEDIAKYIKQNHPKSTGIIYCISKKDCERVSKLLNQSDIKSAYYHAAVADKKRSEVQRKWMEGVYTVLVATVAFGMGIDKHNVRFVIHYSFPKSLENYYQESGRAGRDGQPSDCIIYFSHSDKYKHDHLISKNNRKNQSLQELYTIMKYCEDAYTCRRKMQLEYFGEIFEAQQCKTMCDNCKGKRAENLVDFTEQAVKVVRAVQAAPSGINTLVQFAAFLKESRNKKNEDALGCVGFGVLGNMKIEEIEKLMRKMVYQGVLVEKSIKASRKYKMNKIEPSHNCESLLNGALNIYLDSVGVTGGCDIQPKKHDEKYKAPSVPLVVKDYNSLINIKKIENLRYKPVEAPQAKATPQRLSVGSSGKNSLVNSGPSRLSALMSGDFVPRIPYEKEIEIILDTPLRPISIRPVTKTNASRCSDIRLMSPDQVDELKLRLEIVRRRLARKKNVEAQEVLSDNKMETLANTLTGDVHPDFLKEISYFKEINLIKDSEEYVAESFEFHTMSRMNERDAFTSCKKVFN